LNIFSCRSHFAVLRIVAEFSRRLVTANRGVIAALSRVYYRKLDFSWPRQSIKRFPPADRSAPVHVRSIPHARHCFGKACNRLTATPYPLHPRGSPIHAGRKFSSIAAGPRRGLSAEKLTDSAFRKANKSHLEMIKSESTMIIIFEIANSSTIVNEEINCTETRRGAVNFSWTIFPAPTIATPYINRTGSVF